MPRFFFQPRSRMLPVLWALFLFAPGRAGAASGPWKTNPHGQVRLVSPYQVVARKGLLFLGLEFKTIPGWHVYWKNAGDAGYAPTLSWSGSRGFKNAELLWPAPHRYELPGQIAAFGYEGHVLYPVRARLTSGRGPVHVAAHLSYLTCGPICVPYKYTLELDLPVGARSQLDSDILPAFNAAMAALPVGPQALPGLQVQAQFVGSPQKAAMDFTLHAPEPLSADGVDIFFEKHDPFLFGTPRIGQLDDQTVRLQVSVSSLTGEPVAGPLSVDYAITGLVFRGKPAALEESRTLPLRPGPIPVLPSKSPAGSLGWMALLGFVGGLILNVMPCVLPVLSIKLLGILQHGGSARRDIVRNALASAAGILVSFLGLAAAAILLRQAGVAVGWGIQFQQPVFVGLMAALVFGFALNLLGVFEINIPAFLGRFATSFGQSEGLGAYFVSGIFATLLATPCSAPFLGTAMGFGLAEPAPTVLLIFISAGLGMALPYFVLAAFPHSLRWLPKPGVWMVRLKHFFGWLLVATGIWLASILWTQLRAHPPLPPAVAGSSEKLSWRPFDEKQIGRWVGEGKSVFVDVTADWCFTCKYNEKLVLDSAEVRDAFKKENIILMRADWTRRDNVIGEYLRTFGRAGIPFYVFYRPGQAPIVLSEFLTPGKVLRVLQAPD